MQYLSENSPDHVPKLLDQLRGEIRLKHYSIRTEQAIRIGLNAFFCIFGKKYPRNMGAAEVEQFLTHLAVNGRYRLLHKIRQNAPCCFYIRNGRKAGKL